MEYERKGITITWRIENLKYCDLGEIKNLRSPLIDAYMMNRTNWRLVVHAVSASNIWLSIARGKKNNGPEECEMYYEFSAKELNGSFFPLNEMHSHTFQINKRCPRVEVSMNEMCNRKTGNVLIPDTLIIRCKVWEKEELISKSVHFYARTRIETTSVSFVGVVENFSDFSVNDEKTLMDISSFGWQRLLRVNLVLFRLHLKGNQIVHYIKVDITSMDNPIKQFFNFKIFILDSSGNKSDIFKFECDFTLKTSKQFPLPNVLKEELMENAALYLPNDTLSVYCEITVCSKMQNNTVEMFESEMDSSFEVKETNLSSTIESIMLNENIRPNAKLKTATETFLANTDILSSQSPVFEAMFKTNMKESIQKCVQIDDLDAETVRRMLLFLFTNTFEELEWKDAMCLYSAADKYQILSLKNKCSTLLKQSIDLSNYLVLFIFADRHQDALLKRAVQDYFVKYLHKARNCEQWKNFRTSLPKLTVEILRNLQ